MRGISLAVVLPFAGWFFAVLGQDTDKLEIEVTKAVACERKSQKGDIISVNYNGTFTNGTQFDSSYGPDSDGPFSFDLGTGEVIQGFDQGLLGMCIGEQRKLTIPPRLGYGDHTVGPIPPNSTLIFFTELMGIEGVPKPDNSTPTATAS